MKWYEVYTGSKYFFQMSIFREDDQGRSPFSVVVSNRLYFWLRDRHKDCFGLSTVKPWECDCYESR